MRQLRLVRNIRLGVKNLLLHKLRSMLTMLGVVCGVGSVIGMLSVGEGASQQAMDQIRKLGSNNIIIETIKPAEQQVAGGQQVRLAIYGLTYDDDARLRQTIPTVERTVPAKEIRKDSRLGERKIELRVVGTTPGWFELVSRSLLAGRVLTDLDQQTSAPVCVLTEHGARNLLATRGNIGEWIRIGTDHYQVVGIVKNENSGGNIQTPDSEIDAYVPMSVLKEREGDIFMQRNSGQFIRERVELHKILVQVKSTDQVESTADAVEAVLARFHTVKDYRLSVPLMLLRQAEQTKKTFNIVLGSIAGISLLVGGIGIMNIMLASVTERTREIGIRRAIGAKRRQIIGQFLIETVVLSTLGGLVGTAMGFLLPWLITYFSRMPTIVPGYAIALSLGISVGVGVLFGLYPAIRAANLDPIVALRHE